jgi:hypothetical protein
MTAIPLLTVMQVNVPVLNKKPGVKAFRVIGTGPGSATVTGDFNVNKDATVIKTLPSLATGTWTFQLYEVKGGPTYNLVKTWASASYPTPDTTYTLATFQFGP